MLSSDTVGTFVFLDVGSLALAASTHSALDLGEDASSRVFEVVSHVLVPSSDEVVTRARNV